MLQIPIKGPVIDPEDEATLNRYSSPERKAELNKKTSISGSNFDIKTAWIWRGGRCYKTQPLFLVLNSGEERWRMANMITERPSM